MKKRRARPWQAWQRDWALTLYRGKGVLVFPTENSLLAYASNNGIVLRRGNFGPEDQAYYALSPSVFD